MSIIVLYLVQYVSITKVNQSNTIHNRNNRIDMIFLEIINHNTPLFKQY